MGSFFAEIQVKEEEKLLGCIRFDLMHQRERDNRFEWGSVPTSVMWKHMHQNRNCSATIVPVEYTRTIFGNRSRDLCSTSISFPIPSVRRPVPDVGTD